MKNITFLFLAQTFGDLESGVTDATESVWSVAYWSIGIFMFFGMLRVILKIYSSRLDELAASKEKISKKLSEVVVFGNEFRVDGRSNARGEVKYFVEYKNESVEEWKVHLSTFEHSEALKELEMLKSEMEKLDVSFSESVLVVD